MPRVHRGGVDGHDAHLRAEERRGVTQSNGVTRGQTRRDRSSGGGSVDTFARLESNVRYYSRRWPVVFARAQGTTMYDESGVPYLDFFAGAGSLNYGHNPAPLVEGLIGHLRAGGLVTVLDTASVAKRDLLAALAEVI